MTIKTLPSSMEWAEPENYLGIDWYPKKDNGHHPANTMPEPYKELSLNAFLALFHCWPWGICTTNFRQVVLPDEVVIAGVHFYLFKHHCLAVINYSVGMDKGKAGERSGLLVNNQGWYYRLRFFRVGCSHPNLKTYWTRMHGRRDECPNCGYHIVMDTSG